jgi:hypothetical protein
MSQTIVVKMLTGFKTDKFGLLQNNKKYELPREDAAGFIRNKRAVEYFGEDYIDIDLVMRGTDEAIRQWKARRKRKEMLINTNVKTEEGQVVAKAELGKFDVQIQKLEAAKEEVKTIRPKRSRKKKVS